MNSILASISVFRGHAFCTSEVADFDIVCVSKAFGYWSRFDKLLMKQLRGNDTYESHVVGFTDLAPVFDFGD